VVGGASTAFDEFYEFYEANYFSVCRALAAGLGIGASAAEEAAQEAFVRALVRWRRVAQMDRPSGWVGLRHGCPRCDPPPARRTESRRRARH
jgi:DNA-directed RNA polymerase specialized sigma24 family protein